MIVLEKVILNNDMKMYYGTKEEVKNITDKSGNIVSTEIISKGKSGNSLTLTIDMELQRKWKKV